MCEPRCLRNMPLEYKPETNVTGAGCRSEKPKRFSFSVASALNRFCGLEDPLLSPHFLSL